MAQGKTDINEAMLNDAIKSVTFYPDVKLAYIEKILYALKSSGAITQSEEERIKSFLNGMSPKDIVNARLGIYTNPSPMMQEYLGLIDIHVENQNVPQSSNSETPPIVQPEPKNNTILFLKNMNLDIDPEDPIYKLIDQFVKAGGINDFVSFKQSQPDSNNAGVLMYLISTKMDDTKLKYNLKGSFDYVFQHYQESESLSEHYHFLDGLSHEDLVGLFVLTPSSERYKAFIYVINTLNAAQFAGNNPAPEQAQNQSGYYANPNPINVQPIDYQPQPTSQQQFNGLPQGQPVPNPEPQIAPTPTPQQPVNNHVQNFDNYLLTKYQKGMGRLWKNLNNAMITSANLSVDEAMSLEERAIARKRYILLSSQVCSINYELQHLITQMKKTSLYQELFNKFVDSDIENVNSVLGAIRQTELAPKQGLQAKIQHSRYNHLIHRLSKMKEKEANLFPKQRKAEIKAEVKKILFGRKHKIKQVIGATNYSDFVTEPNITPLTQEELEIQGLLFTRGKILSNLASGTLDRRTENIQSRQSNAILAEVQDVETQIRLNPTFFQKRAMKKTDKCLHRLEELKRRGQGYITGFQEYRAMTNSTSQQQVSV